jgi:hypothetical protein
LLDLDHVAILGDTLTLIAGEKAGIIKKDVPVVSIAVQPQEALTVLEQHAAAVSAPLFLAPSLSFYGKADEGGPDGDPMQANEPMVDQFEDVLGDLASTRLEARRMLFEQAATRLSRLHAAVAPTDPRLLSVSLAPVAARAERRAERSGEHFAPLPQVPPPPRAPRVVAFASNQEEAREAVLVRVKAAEAKAREAEAKAREAEADYLSSMPQPRLEPSSEHSSPSMYDAPPPNGSRRDLGGISEGSPNEPPKVLVPEEVRPLPVVRDAAKSVVTSVKVMSAFGWGRSKATK